LDSSVVLTVEASYCIGTTCRLSGAGRTKPISRGGTCGLARSPGSCHFVRLIIFVGIHVAKAMTGGPTASYGKHGKLQNPFPPRRQTKPVITTRNNGIASFVAEKNFSPKNSDFALRFAPRVSYRNWSGGPRPARFTGSR
jgi:hypothetical protein